MQLPDAATMSARWQERQKQTCCSHAEHVSKVRAGPHEKIFDHIAECFSAFDDAAVKDPQAVLQQYYVG